MQIFLDHKVANDRKCWLHETDKVSLLFDKDAQCVLLDRLKLQGIGTATIFSDTIPGIIRFTIGVADSQSISFFRFFVSNFLRD